MFFPVPVAPFSNNLSSPDSIPLINFFYCLRLIPHRFIRRLQLKVNYCPHCESPFMFIFQHRNLLKKPFNFSFISLQCCVEWPKIIVYNLPFLFIPRFNVEKPLIMTPYPFFFSVQDIL